MRKPLHESRMDSILTSIAASMRRQLSKTYTGIEVRRSFSGAESLYVLYPCYTEAEYEDFLADINRACMNALDSVCPNGEIEMDTIEPVGEDRSDDIAADGAEIFFYGID